jgi:hypothetical protein
MSSAKEVIYYYICPFYKLWDIIYKFFSASNII